MIRSRKQVVVSRPIARSEELLIESVGEETVVYDLQSKEAHCLKPLAAAVFAYADGRNTTSEIAELAEYRLGEAVSESDVTGAIAQLEQRSLIETPLVVRQANGISRREALEKFRNVAGGVLVITPLIATVAAPAAATTTSQIPTGGCCGSTSKGDTCEGLNPTCSANHCCQNNSGKSCNECKCVGDKNDCELCGSPAGTCPKLSIGGVSTSACGTTSSGVCCYPDSNGNCCTVIVSGNGGNVNC